MCGSSGRCFACSNFLISLRTQCAYIPAYMYVHVCVCVCVCLRTFLVSVISIVFCFAFFWGFSVYLNLRSRKRRGTYFNCSPFGHEVQQLSAKLAIVIVLFPFSFFFSASAFASSSVNAPWAILRILPNEFNRKC